MTKLEKLRDEEAENHSSVYINNDIRIRAHVGFQCGWDKRDAIAKEREAKLVDSIEKHHKAWSENGICLSECSRLCQALSDYKKLTEEK